jgi:co-chaperonin GroES (HSP10)
MADTHGEFKPILDRILVRRLPVDEPKDGFVVPEKNRQSSNWGEVIAIGDGVMLGHEFCQMADFVGVGDWVKFGEYTAESFDTNDPDLFIIRIQDVRGVRRKNG